MSMLSAGGARGGLRRGERRNLGTMTLMRRVVADLTVAFDGDRHSIMERANFRHDLRTLTQLTNNPVISGIITRKMMTNFSGVAEPTASGRAFFPALRRVEDASLADHPEALDVFDSATSEALAPDHLHHISGFLNVLSSADRQAAAQDAWEISSLLSRFNDEEFITP